MTDGKQNHADRVADLRGRAEERARQEAAQRSEAPAIVSPAYARELLHELRVREIELEMQREELRRMQSELEVLRQSDAVHRLLADNSVDMISRHAADGTVLYVSPACKQITGYTVDELQGRPAEHLVFSEDVERVWSVIQAAQESNDSWYLAEHRLPRKDGSLLWVETMGRLIRDGEGRVCEIQCNLRDITKRRRVEEALRESEERHRILFTQCKDAVMIIEPPTGRFVAANPSIAGIFGAKDPEEFISLHPWDISPEHQPDGQRSSEKAKIMIETALREGFHYFEWTHRRLDGTEFSAMVTVSRMQMGGQVFLHVVVRDISRQKEAEEALKKARDELEQRVKHRTAELSRANARLRRKRRTLKHMLRASDHERRLIAYEIHDGLAQELAGAVMQFQIYEHQKDMRPEDAQNTFAVGMDLLGRSHREARRLISHVRPPILDESGVLAAIAHLVHDPAFERGPKVDFRSRVTFHRLEPVAENVVYRIVQEGLSNARAHSQSDRIRVSIVERGHRLRIEVRDWGVGFDARNVQENRFGLEGIRERTRILGGKCRIRSVPGQGTAVVVELPVVPSQEKRP